MKVQTQKALEWCMSQKAAACVTGSCLLDYFEGQDIDMFAYNVPAFNQLLYSMYHNPMFIIADPKEQWKLDKWMKCKDYNKELNYGMISIKFKYNTCVDVNIIYKAASKNIFEVLSSFDMDIVAKGFDLSSRQYLDLTPLDKTKADWNRWNKKFTDINAWSIKRLLRQFSRVIKYHNRGYNTDKVCIKYRSIMEDMLKYVDIWKTEKTLEKVKNVKSKAKILITIFDIWLESHSLTLKQEELLEETIKSL